MERSKGRAEATTIGRSFNGLSFRIGAGVDKSVRPSSVVNLGAQGGYDMVGLRSMVPPAECDACPRCQGLLVREDLNDCGGSEHRLAVRCMNCGNVIDPVIAVRKAHATTVRQQESRTAQFVPLRISLLPDPDAPAS